MRFCQGFDHGQSHIQASTFRVRLPVQVKQSRQEIGWNTASRIAHPQLECIALRLDGQRDVSARSRIFGRVRQEIRGDLSYTRRVDADEYWFGWD
jgi:hypothetical protein